MINKSKIVKVKLKRDLTRKIKQGHPWVFEDTLVDIPAVDPGSLAKLVDRKNKFVAFGFIFPKSPLAFRVMQLEDRVPSDDLIINRIDEAIAIRKSVVSDNTNAYRLLNGEGDLLPGLVVDVFDKVAVLQLDGPGPYGFYNRSSIAKYIYENLQLECVFFKARHNSKQTSEVLVGKLETENIEFLEHGARFSCNIIQGQKTGFFLDQRENRLLIRKYAKGLKVLNMFSYTGGFSINAGLGGAIEVKSVDISKPASENANLNWKLNDLAVEKHQAVCQNCFDFIEDSNKQKKKWDIVIVDPPSFAPSQKSLDKAVTSYQKIFSESLKLCTANGYFAASSCSSHIGQELFLEICQNSLSKARKRAQIVFIGGQGCDHPYPLALTEMRYLKFILFKLN